MFFKVKSLTSNVFLDLKKFSKDANSYYNSFGFYLFAFFFIENNFDGNEFFDDELSSKVFEYSIILQCFIKAESKGSFNYYLILLNLKKPNTLSIILTCHFSQSIKKT